MQTPFRIPDFQERYRKADTKRDKMQVLRDWARVTGFLGDAPDIFEDFQAPSLLCQDCLGRHLRIRRMGHTGRDRDPRGRAMGLGCV